MKKTVLRIAIAVLTALLPTIIAYTILDAGGGLIYLIIYSLLFVSLSWARGVVAKPVSLVFLLLQGLLILFGTGVIIISLNLTPASAYLAWFRIAQDGEAAGMQSYMFTAKICFFSTFFAATMIRHGIPKPLIATLTIILIILYAIFQTEFLGYASLAMLVATTVSLAVKGPKRFRRRNIITVVGFILLTIAVTIPLSLIEPRPTNPMIDPIDGNALSKAVISVYPDFPFLYNMPGYGHRLSSKTIGDRPSLTARPVFEVTGNPGETVYLRTEVFEFYTGSGWAYNENSLAQAEFTYGSFFRAEDASPGDNPLSVSVLIDFFSSVPHTISTESVVMNDGDQPELVYGSLDTGFLFEIPVVKGTRFLLNRVGTQSSSDEPKGAYLQLPDNIPRDVVELARLLNVPGEPLKTGGRIKDYLTYNFYYTLEPSMEREWDDPAWEFLLATGEGYCVHFATSFVLLARMNGIPSRYVTGFLAHIPFDGDTVTVSGFSSHAWAEIWVPGRGWTVQEATPPMISDFFDDPSFFELYNPFQNRYTALQLESIMGDRIASSVQVEPERTPFQINPAPAVLVLIILSVLAGTYYLGFRSIHTFGTSQRIVKVISRKMISKGISIGVANPSIAGWRRWSREVTDKKPQKAAKHLNRTIELIQAGFFGGRPHTRREVRFIRRTYLMLFGRGKKVGHR